MKKFLLILMTCVVAMGLYAQNSGDGQPCPATSTVTDKNGNVYNTVMINNQCWMKENMRTTKTATGTSISDGGSTAWTSGSYYYNYSASGIPLAERGYLYNYSAATQICPTGWHLPSQDEWITLGNYLPSYSGNFGTGIYMTTNATMPWEDNDGNAFTLVTAPASVSNNNSVSIISNGLACDYSDIVNGWCYLDNPPQNLTYLSVRCVRDN